MEKTSILENSLVHPMKPVRSKRCMHPKALFMGFLLLMMPTVLEAQFNYTVNTNLTVTITGYTGTDSSVAFPSTINGLPVASIAAFNYPSTVTNITIPSSVTNIAASPFSGCATLLAINVDPSNSFFSSAGGILFDKLQNQVLACPRAKGGSYTIPNTVTNVANAGFKWCANLTNIVMPASLISIGVDAFQGCNALTSVTVPDSVVDIAESAFAACNILNNVVIGNGVTRIAAGAFLDCSRLRMVVLGNKVVSIGDSAFYNCKLDSLTIPNSVTYIGSGAFGYCSLTNVVVGSGLTGLGNGMFAGCMLLSHIAIPTNITSIVDGVFYGCGLTEVVIPDTVTNVGSSAFQSCTKLRNVTMGHNITGIGEGAFGSCSSLATLTIGNGVKNIAKDAFAYCVSLRNVILPNNITNIDVDAFGYCTGLISVTMGRSVSYLGIGAFQSCSNLEAVYFEGPPPTLPPSGYTSAFQYDTHLIVYYVPGTPGWGPVFDGHPTLPVSVSIQTSQPSFGVITNQFGFNVVGGYGLTVVVEAATSAANPSWSALQTNTLIGGSCYFSDPQWTNYPKRFYRVRWP